MLASKPFKKGTAPVWLTGAARFGSDVQRQVPCTRPFKLKNHVRDICPQVQCRCHDGLPAKDHVRGIARIRRPRCAIIEEPWQLSHWEGQNVDAKEDAAKMVDEAVELLQREATEIANQHHEVMLGMTERDAADYVMRPTTNMKASPVPPVLGCTSSTERPPRYWVKTKSKAASVGGLFAAQILPSRRTAPAPPGWSRAGTRSFGSLGTVGAACQRCEPLVRV